MSKRTLQANYFADDKDVFDLLSAARQKLTPQKLADFARRRGIILPLGDDREPLIEQIALLPFGWRDLLLLIESTDTADRAEKVAHRALSGGVSTDTIGDAIDVVRDNRSNRGEVFSVEKTPSGLRVTVRYSEIDPSKTRLVQRTQRDFSLDFESSPSGAMVVRHQDQPRAHEILGEVVQLLAGAPGQNVQEAKIEMAGVRDPALRTDFFLRLIRGVGAHKFEDVKVVKASRFQELADPDEDDGSDSLGVSLGAEDHAITTEEAAFIAHVKDIALKGDGILQTPQYTQLAEHGFFVRSIVWTTVEQKPDGPRVEFEAGFDSPEDGTKFSYTVRGCYSRKLDGEHKKQRANPSQTDRTRLLRLVEQAARTALDEVVSVAANPVNVNAAEVPVASTAPSVATAPVATAKIETIAIPDAPKPPAIPPTDLA